MGVALTDTPSPEQIAEASRRMLEEPRYRRRAQALRARYAKYSGPVRAAEVVLEVAGVTDETAAVAG